MSGVWAAHHHLPHLVTHSRTQLPLLRKSRLVSDEQETNCYNGCRQDGHKEKSCGENHALSISMVIYCIQRLDYLTKLCAHQTEGGSIVMSRCQSVFTSAGEPCSKWQLCCTMVNMVTRLHPLMCSEVANCSEKSDNGGNCIGVRFLAMVHPPPFIAPCTLYFSEW